MWSLEALLVLLLVLLNGFLAMSELAIVSGRRSRLQALARGGNAGAATALTLMETPGRFLSSVQIGITLVGVLAGAFSGATLARDVAVALASVGMPAATADSIGLVLVVTAITYLSLILGELVPKQMALRNPEGVAVAVAGPMLILARLASPIVWFLDLSSRLILRAMGGGRQAPESLITEDEIKGMIAEAEQAGLVEPAEKRMISAIMRLGDQPARAVMTPRREVVWIDLEDDEAEILNAIRASTYSRLLVSRKVIDEVVGVVQAKDLLDAFLDGAPFAVEAHVRPALAVPEGADALQVIDILRRSPAHMAVVVDEYGGFQGIVTPADILETIVGGFDDASGLQQEAPVRRDDGSWLLDGWMSCEEMSDLLDITLPAERDFHTIGGFVLARLRQVPHTGDRFDWRGWRFEVVDMDGRRVDKVLATRVMTLHRP